MTNTRRGPLLLILFAALMAGAGNGITIVAFPWLVLQRNGSALEASIVAMAGTLPLLVGHADRRGGRRLSGPPAGLDDLRSAVGPVGRRSADAGPDLRRRRGRMSLRCALLAGLGAFFDPAGMTARETMLPEAAGRAGWTLDHANSVYEAVFNLAYIVGPGIGGLLIATLGGINTMWVTAGAFCCSILAISVLRLEGAGTPTARHFPRARGRESSRGCDSSGTHRYCAHWRSSIWWPPGSTCRWSRFCFPSTSPTVTSRPNWAGVLMALEHRRALGCTRLCGAVEVHEPTGHHADRGDHARRGDDGDRLPLPPLPLILVLCAIVGFVYGPIAPIYNYVMQTTAPQHLRGRVVGVMGSLAYAAGPLGLILAGPLADAAGLHATFLALSLPMLLLGLVALSLTCAARAWTGHGLSSAEP